MILVAFVLPSGEVSHILDPGNSSQIKNLEYYDGLLAVHISVEADPVEFKKTNIWNFAAKKWTNRPNQPSRFHVWAEGRWLFKSEYFWESIRSARTQKLYESDWTQISDAPLTSEQKQEWTAYRQQLREVPETNAGVTIDSAIIWPEKPTTPRN